MSNLTASQLAVLRAADGSWRTRDELAERATEHHGWTGRRDGLNQTLGSLVRRGLVDRMRLRSRVHFQITDKGLAAVRSYPAQTRTVDAE